jgi:VanZ family protein
LTLVPPRRSFFHLFVWFWAPVLAYVAVIFTLSAQPNLQPPFHFNNSDKYCHMLEYGGLGFLLSRAIRAAARLRLAHVAALVVTGLGAAIGAADEMFQSYIPGRDSSLHDWTADVAGLLLVQLLYLLFTKD